MNLPSPDDQLDMHGPRAKLPFEQIPPQSRAGVKSSHEALEQDRTLIGSNGIITSGGTSSNDSVSKEDNQVSLVSPAPASSSSLSGQKRPDHGGRGDHAVPPLPLASPLFSNKEDAAVDVFSNEKGDKNQSTSLWSRFAWPWSRSGLDQQRRDTHGDHPSSLSSQPHHTSSSTSTAPQMHTRTLSSTSSNSPHGNTRNLNRPLNRHVNTNPLGFGTFDSAHRDDQEHSKQTRFQKLSSSFKRFLGFVGPGYMVSVGYMDPGNWATDLAGGSSYGYMLLFVILMSNLMAIVLQGLAVKLGVVSGLDLAQACRKFTPKYVNWVLYVLAELAIIACDLAEVIGSAIALNLLFKIPLAWGVVITAADVLIILFAFRDDQSVKSRRVFEALVILLVSSVGVCFTVLIVYSEPVAKDVFRGFLPDTQILTEKDALFLSIGIIGATVMPHNLYLHSSIVKLRTSRELTELASSQASMSSTSDLMTVDQRQVMLEEDKGAVSVKHSTIRSTLRYTFWDSTVALTFALYVNSAILIVAAATFKYKHPDVDNSGLADFFSAFDLLGQYLGRAASYLFAVALLMAGQSSTLTATLAGQIIMEGFLGSSYLKPWVRRLLTRCLAIIPALAIVLIKGQDGLSSLLLASQVALSIQLPFAVIPLVFFTSMGRCMTISVQDNSDKPGDMSYGRGWGKDLKQQPGVDGVDIAPASSDEEHRVAAANGAGTGVMSPSSTIVGTPVVDGGRAGDQQQLFHNFANAWWLVGIAGLISIILLGLNFYLLVQTMRGEE
ncbi:MAG: transporter smf2 [Linnemannia gamsii]|nr:MAG: transporter smf2 [Linnemannia gamsii]